MEIVAIVFGMPVLIVGIKKFFDYKTARLKLEEKALGQQENLKKIEVLQQDRKQLVQRVENLETIVTSVDMELNQRLNRLAEGQSLLALGPGPSPGRSEVDGDAITSPADRRPVANTQPGRVLMGRFTVERSLGSGGMGEVFLAHDSRVDERVALKVIAPNLAEDPSAVERFRREVGAARKITHPNVIRIHDLGEDEGLLFLSMEYFEGQTLGQMLARRGGLPEEEALRILAKVCDALTAAHAAGVVHRDLKPGNILVDDQEQVRVIDFGLARASYMRTMTATGMIMGTPEYMAPEQVRGTTTDHRTDIYALGAVTYHMLAGEPPFVADSPIAVGFMHCSEEPVPLSQRAVGVAPGIERAVHRALAKDPADRFDSVAGFRGAVGA